MSKKTNTSLANKGPNAYLLQPVIQNPQTFDHIHQKKSVGFCKHPSCSATDYYQAKLVIMVNFLSAGASQ